MLCTKSPVPKSFSELKTTLGAFSFYCRFIQNFTEIVEPLRELLSCDTFKWSVKAQKAFEMLKRSIITSPALAVFDPKKEVVVSTDASNIGAGGTLSQANEDGSLSVIEFFSKEFSVAERKYSTTERESLAVVLALEKWRTYLLGRSFVLETDHQCLKMIFSTKGMDRMSLRIARWAVRLLPYVFTIRYKKGSEMFLPDYLSRFPIENENDEFVCTIGDEDTEIINSVFTNMPITVSDLKNKIENDESYKKIRNLIENDNQNKKDWENCDAYYRIKNELSVVDGLIFRGDRVVIPTDLRCDVLKLTHETHIGIVKMKQRIRVLYWWPNFDKDVEKLIANCNVCQSIPKSVKPKNVPYESVPLPSVPFEKIAVDIKGPIPVKIEARFAIVVIDYFSKYPEVKFVRNVTTESVISFLKEIFAREGTCANLVCDNGSQFTSKEFEEFCKSYGIKLLHSSLYYPQGNSMVERFNRCLSDAIDIHNNTGGCFIDSINSFLMTYRSSCHSTTGLSPSLLLHGREMRTRLNIVALPESEFKNKVKKTVRFDLDVDKSEDNFKNPFTIGDKVKWVHPRTKVVQFGTVEKLLSSKCVLVNGKAWNIRKLAKTNYPAIDSND